VAHQGQIWSLSRNASREFGVQRGKEISVSNIPNSAMPHAWAHDDDDDDEQSRSANQQGFTLAGMALAGGALALIYWIFRRK
jgi:hypothetical protein